MRDTAFETTPMRRFAEPVEVASAIPLLAGQAASCFTGTILTVEGGHTCR